MLRTFEICQPATLQEASKILSDFGDQGVIYAGGTELLLVMKAGLAHYPHLIDVKKIPDLGGIQLDPVATCLTIGALATHRQIERHALVLEHAPLFARVEHQIANVRIRAAGSLGGNLCFGEPHSDPATLLMAWGAALELVSSSGHREVPIEDFVIGPFETSRRSDEILARIRLPLLNPHVVGAFERFAVQERPLVNVAVLINIQTGTIRQARIAVGCVGPKPTRIAEAEKVLIGRAPEPGVFQQAAACAGTAVDPITDLNGSEDYKRHLVKVLTLQALQNAVHPTKGAADAI